MMPARAHMGIERWTFMALAFVVCTDVNLYQRNGGMPSMFDDAAPEERTGNKRSELLMKTLMKRLGIVLAALAMVWALAACSSVETGATPAVNNAREGWAPPFDDPKTYIQALEEAMDARYGGRDAWPQGFDVFLAMAKYHSGLEKSYKPMTAWASGKLQALEEAALTSKEAAAEFLSALRDEIAARVGLARTWSYEAHALSGAAYVYSGNASLAGSVTLPRPEDLTEDEAIAIAREAIQKQYDLTDEDIEELGVYAVYFRDDAFYGSSWWSITIGINDQGFERYYANITTPAGEIMVATRNDGNG
jgi:hypothetical protein